MSDEVHKVLGITQEAWDVEMEVGRRTKGWNGMAVTNDPLWHSHPLLGITGHLHKAGRTPHAHRPTWTWDSTPVFLSGTDDEGTSL